MLFKKKEPDNIFGSLRMDAMDDSNDEVRRNFHINRYIFAKEFARDKNVLDGACGAGYGTKILAETACNVTGIDLDIEAIKYAVKYYNADNIKYKRCPVELTSFDHGQFDVVISFETIEHTLCPESHVREMARILRHDGIAIVSAPNNWGLTDHHFFDFDYESFTKLLKKNFNNLELFYNTSVVSDSESGIGKLVNANDSRAECIIAICTNPIRMKSLELHERYLAVMKEIYSNSFKRHNEYLKIKNKVLHISDGGLFKRINNKLRRI